MTEQQQWTLNQALAVSEAVIESATAITAAAHAGDMARVRQLVAEQSVKVATIQGQLPPWAHTVPAVFPDMVRGADGTWRTQAPAFHANKAEAMEKVRAAGADASLRAMAMLKPEARE